MCGRVELHPEPWLGVKGKLCTVAHHLVSTEDVNTSDGVHELIIDR